MVRRTAGVCIAQTLALALAVIAADAGAVEPSKNDAKKECFKAHEQGQLSKTARKLRAAAEMFKVCAADACPDVVREECEKWMADLRTAIPTVVPAARDAQGHDTADVRVLVDGEPLTERLDGRSFELDPGEHVFRYVLADGTTIEEKYIINEGDARRALLVDFSKLKKHETKPPPPPPPSRPVPIAAWVLGGVGVAALGSFTIFALSGKSKENDLKSCAPNCPDAEVTTMDHRYLAADISLGVGLVSLGAATWVFLARKPAEPATSGTRFDVIPTRGAGMLRLTTQF